MSLSQAILLVFFSFIANITLAAWPWSSSVSPTTTNSSGAYYISSKTTLKSKTIACSKPNCHIICDASCEGVTISAAQSSFLTIDCLTSSSCKKAQLKKGPTDSVTINCLAPTACANATFQFNGTTTAAITCRYNATREQVRMNGSIIGTCKYARFYGQGTSAVSVDCNGVDCLHSAFHVNNSKTAEFRMHNPSTNSYTETNIFGSHITNALIVKCLHSNSCRQNAIYCPQNALCELHCKETVACANNIYVKNNNYNGLYLNVSSRTALYDTDVRCLDTNHFSIMEYQMHSKEWGYDDRAISCCPNIHTLGLRIFTCETGVDCIETRGVDNEDDVIDATNASSLTLTCTGDNSCEGKTIQCPATSCNVVCDGVNACKQMKVHIVQSDTLNISCVQSLSCVGLAIWPKQFAHIYIDNVTLSCEMTQSCANVSVGYGVTVGTLDVQCTATKSCERMQFLGATPSYTTEIKYVATSIMKASTINCAASMACHKLQVNLKSYFWAHNHIYCDNALVSTNGTGACYQSRFYLYGISLLNGDWNVVCNTFDCQKITIESSGSSPRNPSNSLRMQCYAPHSCASSSISASNANELHLECKDKGSCYKSIVRGASLATGATQIVCGAAEKSCGSMAINSPYDFAQSYLNLTCPSGSGYKSSCDMVRFECDTFYYPTRHKKNCVLYYDESTYTFDTCALAEDDDPLLGNGNCCPLRMYNGSAIITTTAVDNRLTSTAMDHSTSRSTAVHHSTSESTKVDQSTSRSTAVDHSNLRSTAVQDSNKEHKKEEKSNTIVLGVVIGSLLVVMFVAFAIWFRFQSKQKQQRVDAGALLAGQINDHSDERGVGVVVDRDSYAPPTTAAAGNHVTQTELTAP